MPVKPAKKQTMDFALHINRGELKMGNEIPLLLKLRLKNLFKRNFKAAGKTLVINTCIIGDFLATLPALRTFIEKNGKNVDLVVSPPLKSLAEGIRGVDRVFTARSVWERPIEQAGGGEAPQGEYGHVLLLRISPDASSLLKRIKYSSISTYEVPYFKYAAHLVKSVIFKTPVKQWREVNYEIIGLKEPSPRPGFGDIFAFTDKDLAGAAALPELAGPEKKVLIHSGSGWKIKLWENAKWAELIGKIHRLGGYKFIFIGGGAFEEASFKQIRASLGFEVRSLINKIDLRATMLAMRLCDYFIGIDSGPRNMAHLADLRSISLLGPAPKNFMPLNPEDIVIDKFDCRCKSLFYLHKVSGMQKISAQEVFESFKKLSTAASGNRQARPVSGSSL